MRKLLLLASAFLAVHCTQAQTSLDIYNMSDFSPQGSARSIGLGGVNASLGGDFTGAATNPATLGIYRASQGGMTVSFNNQSSTSNYLGNTESERDFSFGVNQLYYVTSSADNYENKKDASSWTFGFGLNRVQNYNKRYIYERTNTQTSYLDQVVGDYNAGTDLDKAWYAWDVGLTDTAGNTMSVAADPRNGRRNQLKNLHQKGSMSEFNMVFARNMNNEFMIGLGLGIPFGSYGQEINIREKDVNNTMSNFDFMEYREGFTSSIVGVNANLGIIYQPEPFVRLGAWVKSPTSFAVTDTFYYNFSSDVEGYDGLNGTNFSSDYIGVFDYRVVSAFKWGLSSTYLFEDKGLISFDYMMSKPNNNKLRINSANYNDYERDINTDVQRNYTTQHTFRTGMEARIRQLYLRLGGNYRTNPLQADLGDQKAYGFSLGVGFRSAKMAFSLAVAKQYLEYYDHPYPMDNLSGVHIKEDYTNFVFSLGFR